MDSPLRAASRTVPSPEQRHLKPLDGIRGLAILMVMLSHAFQVNLTTSGPLIRFVGDILSYGRYGVDLFFVLSGFLITGILMDTRHDPRCLSSFFGRRALRILPLYYGLLVLLLVLTPVFHFAWNGMAPWLLLYLQNWKPAQINHLSLSPGPIGLYHFWSLAIEEQFYLVWPWIVYLVLGRRRPVFWTSAILSALILLLRLALIHHGTNFLVLHMNSFTRADSLFLGGALAALYRSSRWWPRVLAASPAVFTLFAIVLACPLVIGDVQHIYQPLWNEGFSYTALAIGSGALLAWSLKPASSAAAIFSLPPLRQLGKYSYGLYVLHVPIYSLLEFRLRLFLTAQLGSKLLATVLCGLILCAVSFAAAVLSFRFYEQPFLRLKRRFTYTRIDPARPA